MTDYPFPNGMPPMAENRRRINELITALLAEARMLQAEVSRLHDTVAERDAEIDTLRAMIAEEDK